MRFLVLSLFCFGLLLAQPQVGIKRCSKHGDCDVGFYCSKDNTCKRMLQLGDACTYPEQCDPSLTCPQDPQEGNRFCAIRASPNAACQIDNDCRDSYYCGPDKKCLPVRQLNAFCRSQRECNEGLRCDTGKMRCVLLAPSNSSNSTVNGTALANGTVALYSGHLMQPCTDTQDCAPFLFCNISSPFRCIPKFWNNTCRDNIDCYKGWGCGRNGKCTLLKQIDEICDPNHPCADSLFCNSGRRCQVRGTVDISVTKGWTRSLLNSFQQFANGTRVCGGLNKESNAACFQRHLKNTVKCTLYRGRDYSTCFMDDAKIANVNVTSSMNEITGMEWRGYEFTQGLELTPVRSWDCRSGNGNAWFLLNYNMPNVNHPVYLVYDCVSPATALSPVVQNYANATARALETCRNNQTCESTVMTQAGCPEHVVAGANSWCLNANPFVAITNTLMADTYLALIKFSARVGSTTVRVSQFYSCQDYMAWFRLDVTGEGNSRSVRWLAFRCPINYTEIIRNRAQSIATSTQQCGGSDAQCVSGRMISAGCSFFSATSSICYDYSIPRIPIQSLQSSINVISTTAFRAGSDVSVQIKRAYPCSGGFTWIEFNVSRQNSNSTAWACYHCHQ